MNRALPVRLALIAGLFLVCYASYSYALDCPAVQREVEELDRQAGTVRVTYVRDGKTYEEQWRVKRVTTTAPF